MLIYMKLEQCQELYSAYGRLTSLSLNLNKNEFKDVRHTKKELITMIDNGDYVVKDWKEINPELVQQIESDNGGGIIMIAILYLVVAFGIFGTVLMMTAERRKEFGVMVAVGMKKKKLAMIVTLEMIFLGILAIISGVIASIPIIQWYHHNPVRLTGDLAKSIENFGMEAVMPMAWQLDIFVNQILIVIILVFFAIFYPISSITRIKVIKALRH
jgi:ABC-type lipoprotein release transport system permease subunit